jgi:hypothetical protein
MRVKMAKPVIAWSHSALNKFETCPKQFFHLRVKRDFKEEENEHLRYGKKVHKALDLRISQGKKLPMELTHLEPVCQSFCDRKGEILTEQQLALDGNFEPCDWFDPNAYVRAVLDLVVFSEEKPSVFIGDWKTGAKISDDFSEFFRLAFLYTKTKSILTDALHRDDIGDVWAENLQKVRRLEKAVQTTEFPARPSGLCRRHCPIRTCGYFGS